MFLMQRKQNKRSLFSILFFLISLVSVAQNGTWTWMHGANTPNSLGSFGVQGVAAPSNDPPALYESVSWTDLNGNFWIFGGIGNVVGTYNALWKFDPIANMWTWMKGANTTQQAGNYGVQGVPSVTNNPGSRAWGACSWVDTQGHLWLFGGHGSDAFGNSGKLNDLWMYDISTNLWTWMHGSTIRDDFGDYGGFQIPNPSNLPPSRDETNACWIDHDGNFWMFGGSGNQYYDDMWMYNPATNQWAWMSGSDTPNNPPSFGTQQVAASSNTPGARLVYGHWTDCYGNFWIMGGTNTNYDVWGDMWMYNPRTYQWTWMAGSSQTNILGSFSTKCQTGNALPAARMENTTCWTDSYGRFWQYGGSAWSYFYLNDLWMFDPITNQFTWISGSLTGNSVGNYGQLGVPAPTNNPEGSNGAVSFTDLQGNFWMFGGWTQLGRNSALWRYQIDSTCPGPGTPAPLIAYVESDMDTGCIPNTVYVETDDFNSLTYHWDFGDQTTIGDTSNQSAASYTYTNAGTYTVSLVIQGTARCASGIDTAYKTIVMIQGASVDLGNDTTICGPIYLRLDAGYPDYNHDWNTGSYQQSILVSSAGSYDVVLTNSYGCFAFDTIVIRQATTEDITPPNVFTPNQDGINDLYELEYSSADSYAIQIYDRWGKLVFASDDATQKWDGNFEGKPCSDGVYYWIISFTNCEDEKQIKHGFVQLIR